MGLPKTRKEEEKERKILRHSEREIAIRRTLKVNGCITVVKIAVYNSESRLRKLVIDVPAVTMCVRLNNNNHRNKKLKEKKQNKKKKKKKKKNSPKKKKKKKKKS